MAVQEKINMLEINFTKKELIVLLDEAIEVIKHSVYPSSVARLLANIYSKWSIENIVSEKERKRNKQ